jgi:predicted Zn-dependent protease
MTLKLEPAFLPARRLMAAALQGLERPHDAVVELEKALAQVPDDPVTLAWLVHARAAAGDAAGAAAAAARVRAHTGPRPLSAYHLAIAELGDGNPGAAIAALERAVEERDPAVANIATEPRFAPVHAHPCFVRLVDRIGLRVDWR